MDTSTAIKHRRCIRRYQSRDIPDAVIDELLHLACHAPSSLNGQPWHFIVIRDQETKRALVEIKNRYCPREKSAYPADFVGDAPVVIVVCVETERSYGRSIENATLAASYIMLAACAFGLGSAYLTACRAGQPALTEDIRLLLNIPAGIEPITVVPLGYPGELPSVKDLRPLGEIVHHDRFNSKT
jgi:nitroreductase